MGAEGRANIPCSAGGRKHEGSRGSCAALLGYCAIRSSPAHRATTKETTSSMSEPACYTLQIDGAHRFLRQTWHEPVTAGALITLWRTGRRSARPRRVRYVGRPPRDERGTHHQRRRHAGQRREAATPSQRAIVTANDADCGVMCMLELKAGGGLRGYGVFRTIDEACV